MKPRILTAGWLFSGIAALALLGLPATAHAQTLCTNDTDCTANGTACGTDVCDWNQGKTCVSATSAQASDWCGGDYTSNESQAMADSECKCHGQGATCSDFHCTFFVPADAGGTPDASATEDAGHASSTSSSSTSSSTQNAGTTTSTTSAVGSESSSTGTTAGTSSHATETESESSSAGGGGGGSSGGCNVSPGVAGAPWECGALMAVAMIATRRRRRR
jgi:MYXO-CTERM domain-containing protein